MKSNDSIYEIQLLEQEIRKKFKLNTNVALDQINKSASELSNNSTFNKISFWSNQNIVDQNILNLTGEISTQSDLYQLNISVQTYQTQKFSNGVYTLAKDSILMVINFYFQIGDCVNSDSIFKTEAKLLNAQYKIYANNDYYVEGEANDLKINISFHLKGSDGNSVAFIENSFKDNSIAFEDITFGILDILQSNKIQISWLSDDDLS